MGCNRRIDRTSFHWGCPIRVPTKTYAIRIIPRCRNHEKYIHSDIKLPFQQVSFAKLVDLRDREREKKQLSCKYAQAHIPGSLLCYANGVFALQLLQL